jgi:hypothetical protein
VQLPRNKLRIARQTVDALVQEQVIDPGTAARIHENLQPLRFDWKRLAQYSFVAAIVCAMISVVALLADKMIIAFVERVAALVEKLFRLPYAYRSIACAVVSAAVILLGLKLRRRHPEKIYSNEAVFFVGVLGIAASIACLGKAIDTGSGHFSLLILLAALVYGFLGLALASRLIWVFGLLSLGGWFGAETGYQSGWGAYYLGMAYPLRFVLFGLALTLASVLLMPRERIRPFFPSTRVIGLLYLFIALWILSIWGNHQGYDDWRRAPQIELLHWALLFGLAAVICIYLGLKHDDAVLRGFGLTFLFLNLYTRFFEYLWNNLHRGIFFAVLALSFWLVGSRAETIWHLRTLRNKLHPSDD